MPDTIDKRLTDLEGLVYDLPHLLNLRMERVDGILSDHTARFNLLDKQVGMLLRDVRDMRSGVTRQLSEQDRRIAVIEQDIAALKSDVSTLKSDVSTLKSDVSTLKSDVSTLKSDMSEVKAGIAELLSRLPKA